MHVKIVGFKCHVDTYYDFYSGDMILLKGPSGSGKSTILQAIFWCLYGSMRGIYNNTGQTKSCSVTLSINDLIIYRQKRPELLRVTIVSNNNNETNENNYEDIVAQQIINQAFGTRNLWKSCSYVGQKERCCLLSGSSSERLTLLNQLSFEKDNPKEYISRIDQELKSINEKFLTTQAGFTAELKLFTQQMTERRVTVNINDDAIDKLYNNINKTETDIKSLYDKILEHERTKGSYDTLMEQIKRCEMQLGSYNNSNNKNIYDENRYNIEINIIQSEIDKLRPMISKINTYEETKRRVETIKFQIDQVNTKINETNIKISSINGGNNSDNIVTNNEQIWHVSNQESQRTKYNYE